MDRLPEKLIDQGIHILTGCFDSGQTLAAAQEFVTGPARQGMAIMSGVKAVLDVFRSVRESSRRRAAPRPGMDEEESLFIG